MVKNLLIPLSMVGGGLYTRKELNEMASNLLQILEDKGMQPPSIPDPENLSHPENDFVNEWEEE